MADRYPQNQLGYPPPRQAAIREIAPARDLVPVVRPSAIEATTTGVVGQSRAVARLNAGLVRGLSGLATLPKPVWLIPGVMPARSVFLLFGPFSSGKSFVALDMVASIAHGVPWLGLPTRKTPVLYIAGEGSFDLQARGCAWAEENGFSELDMLLEVVPPDLSDAEQLEWVIDIALTERCGVVVVDTLAQSIPGVEENSAKEMGVVVKALYRIVREVGATVLVVHHTGHSRQLDPRGSVSLPSNIDAAIAIHNAAGDMALKLWSYKQKFARAHYYLPPACLVEVQPGSLSVCVEWLLPTLVVRPDSHRSDTPDAPTDSRILAALRDMDRPASQKDIVAAAKVGKNKVGGSLQGLSALGLVDKLPGERGRTLWRIRHDPMIPHDPS